ncbi:helix-turn-helix domain-containing protein [Kiloniella sp. EL199]|uniref:helix-turn-helix domain-containing protein n=1 Tax=Kiloniella sp. EL199 TaxID=2107581 RepID=UPI000EA00596|nr:helix-turn-helix domain-containing protein [Kiloniella sp. EL199]
MATGKLPWFKFFPTDWRADVGLKLCSLAARGLWLEMICIMHEAGGYLEINGSIVTTSALASLSGSTPQEITALLGELEEAGVFSRDRKGRLYSRRMLRDLKKSSLARSNGRKGGNPSLVSAKTLNGETKAPSLSPKRKKQTRVKRDQGEEHKVPDKTGDKPQSPKARDQTLPLTPKGVKSPHDPDVIKGKAVAELKSKATEPTDARSQANRQQANRRGSRLDTDWVPDQRDQDFARTRGIEEEDIATEALKFRNYWTSLGGRRACKIDWHRTWQNWILRIQTGNRPEKAKSSNNTFGNNPSGCKSTGGNYSSGAAGCGQRSGGLNLGEIGVRVLGRAEIQDNISQGRRQSGQVGGSDFSPVYDEDATD